VRPALVYREGDPLVVGRAALAMAEFPEDTVVLLVPAAGLERS